MTKISNNHKTKYKQYRRVFIVSLWLLLINYTIHAQNEVKSKQDFNSLSWLEGSWKRTNLIRANRTAFEYWKKTGEFELSGMGITLQGNDTVFVETLLIKIVNNELHYIADVKENNKPIHFVFTHLATKQFVCENPAHDYPKKISYQLVNNQLQAIISGNGKETPFIFELISH